MAPTTRIARTAVLALLLVLATGCGKAAEEGIQNVAEAPRQSATLACRLEYRAVEDAIDAYTALNGTPPTSNADLLGVLKDEPTYVEIEADGSLGLTDRAEELGCTLEAAKGG
ncbi:MAG: hypothetical protein KF906_01480 [Actinobacteria bacterium]|nr:hypothetical protein [Actinomycetota bacterium]